MKRTLRILAAGLAASLALVSCDKESLTKTDNGASKDDARTITVSFADVTRSGLSDLQPYFKDKDVIKVSDGTTAKDCEVTIKDGVATITTDLTGELSAVYPASASTDGKTFSVSSTAQDGSFAMANICTATIPDGANPKAEFVNQTAILKFSVPAKGDKGIDYSPKTIKVKSRGSENIADGSNEITITGKGENGIITPSDGGFYYMAVLPGETISKLTVCSGEGMRCPTASGTLTANFIYDVALPVLNGHEYVELTIPVMTWDGEFYEDTGSTKTLRWATTNVGASSPTDYGDYFAWGETTGWKPSENTFSHYFGWSNTPYVSFIKFDYCDHPDINNFVNYFTISKYFTKTDGPDSVSLCFFEDCNKDDINTLDFVDDAAYVNWGGSWRMPTQEEFAGLLALDPEYTGWDGDNKGYRLTDANGNSIFLPAAGNGDGTVLNNAGVIGYYWSSSLDPDFPSYAFCFFFHRSGYFADHGNRYIGYSVRPLSE